MHHARATMMGRPHDLPVAADIGSIDTWRFQNALADGHNPFDLPDGRKRFGPDAVHPGDIRIRLVDAMLGTDLRVRDRMESAARHGLAGTDGTLTGPDAVTTDMLVHVGYDPLAAAIIKTINGAFDARQTLGGSAYAVLGPIDKVVTEGLHWESDGRIRVPLLPTIVAMALCTGAEPLSGTLTHPVLDRHMLLVMDVTTDEARGMSVIRVVHDHTPTDAERLIAARLPRTDM